MKNLQVISSTFSAAHLGEYLQRHYNFGESLTCTLLKTGINHSYLLNTETGKYVFRVYSYNWRTEIEINEEVRLLNLLNENGIPISFAIADNAANYIQQLQAPEGNRFGVMFSFAKGGKQLNLSETIHYQIGTIMARMHELTVNLKLQRETYSPKTLLVDSFDHLKKFLPQATAEMDFMVTAQQYLLKEFVSINEPEVRLGAVHLDIWFDNISIDEEDNVTIFDFDFCGNGMLALDLAYYILQINSTEKDEAECQQKTEAFLAGYESATPISAEEKRIIPMLGVSLYFFYLGVQCRRFDNWSNVFLNETYLTRFINLLVKKYFEKNVSKN